MKKVIKANKVQASTDDRDFGEELYIMREKLADKRDEAANSDWLAPGEPNNILRLFDEAIEAISNLGNYYG